MRRRPSVQSRRVRSGTLVYRCLLARRSRRSIATRSMATRRPELRASFSTIRYTRPHILASVSPHPAAPGNVGKERARGKSGCVLPRGIVCCMVPRRAARSGTMRVVKAVLSLVPLCPTVSLVSGDLVNLADGSASRWLALRFVPGHRWTGSILEPQDPSLTRVPAPRDTTRQRGREFAGDPARLR